MSAIVCSPAPEGVAGCGGARVPHASSDDVPVIAGNWCGGISVLGVADPELSLVVMSPAKRAIPSRSGGARVVRSNSDDVPVIAANLCRVISVLVITSAESSVAAIPPAPEGGVSFGGASVK